MPHRSSWRSAVPTVAWRFDTTEPNFTFLAATCFLPDLVQMADELEAAVAGGGYRRTLDTRSAAKDRFDGRAKLDSWLARHEPATPST